jgi:hypothetical protein
MEEDGQAKSWLASPRADEDLFEVPLKDSLCRSHGASFVDESIVCLLLCLMF